MTTRAHRNDDVNRDLFLFNFFYDTCLLISFLEKIHAMACPWKSRSKLQESILSFHCVVPGTKLRSPDPVTGNVTCWIIWTPRISAVNSYSSVLSPVKFRLLPRAYLWVRCRWLTLPADVANVLCPWGRGRGDLQLHELLGISLHNRFFLS